VKLRTTLAVATVALATGAPTAVAAQTPAFAPEGSATIRPGVQTLTDGAQCTSNFVFYDDSAIYLGQAAHCSGTGGAQETNGCEAKSLPLGTPVEISGASRPGRLAYNSWLTMQRLGEKDPDTCQYNDFALVAIDPADAAKVSPSMPTFGVPTGLNTSGTSAGDAVRSFGNSKLRGGIEALSPKYGVSLGQEAGGWNHPVFTVTPGVPGDSGSGFIDAEGRAFGVLSTLSILPVPGTNGVSDLGRALKYAVTRGGPNVVLADQSRTPAPAAAAAAPAAAAPATAASVKRQATAKRAAAKKAAAKGAAVRRAAAKRAAKRAAARKAAARSRARRSA
jgi:hypothetical protein